MSLISMEQVISASPSHSPLFSLYHIPATLTGYGERKRSLKEIHVCVHARNLSDISSSLVCACDVEIRRDGQKSPAAVCLFVCITGACHSITGHTNLIIQLWAQCAGVYERDSSAGQHRPQSVTTLPLAAWQTVSVPTLIAHGCFPDWLLWEWAAFASI